MQYCIMRKYVSGTHVHTIVYLVTTSKTLILLLLLLLRENRFRYYYYYYYVKIGSESSVFHIRNLKPEPENYVCVFCFMLV